jgi:hypothetical protein
VAIQPPAQPTQPPGAELAYEVLSDQVVRQLAAVEGLDAKLGVAVAALIAVTGAIYAAAPPRIVAAVVSVWVLGALVQAIRGFRYAPYTDGVNVKFLEGRMHLQPAEIKLRAWVVLKIAEKENRQRLDRKGGRLMQVTYTLGVIAGVALLGKVLGVS